MAGAVGRITRGTTGLNRLRRVDRWIAAQPTLRRSTDPLVVDLGYGATPSTAVELFTRMRAVRPDAEVVGVEIDPERVRAARDATREGLSFRLGGFEVPAPGGRRPAVIRALNVLRQYREEEVPEAWQRMRERLQPAGLLVEGTCSELGRVASWVGLSPNGPETLTLSMRLADLSAPSLVAERLPKALIHRNVPGQPIHDLLRELDDRWARAAPLAVYGPSQRFIATAAALRDAGWPVRDRRSRWRLGELTVGWSAVAPH